MSRFARQTGIAAALALTLLSVAPALAQTDSEYETILNAVVAEQEPGQAAFNVTAYATVIDDENQPITGLGQEHFSLSEDGAPVPVLDVSPATQPSNIVLVLDTSGSMAFQGKIEAVQTAAASFVSRLAEEDQVAIITFNESADILKELSGEQLAATSIIDLLTVAPGTGTCLYDAAYKATILATTAPQGRRAVILLTDGVDEMPDAPGVTCSAHSAEDVIALASGGTTRSPIYTIGIGSDANAEELAQIAEQTGGTSMLATSPGQIEGLFEAISQQLKSQYALTYRSTTTSGEQHSLGLTVTLDGVASVDQRDFILPEPVLLIVTSLNEGDVLAADGTVSPEATITGMTEVASVSFSLDGEPLGAVTTPPFEFSLDAGEMAAGRHSLTVRAELADGQQLEHSVRFEVEAPPPEPTEVPPPLPPAVTETPANLRSFLADNPLLLEVGGAVLLGLVALAVLAARRRPVSRIIGGAGGYSGPEDMTHSIRFDQVLGMLTVRESPRLLPGQPFDIGEEVVRLGSGADSDVLVPDGSVSPRHAEIHISDGEVFQLFDLNSEHGTRVNGEPVGAEGRVLRTGDLITLGSESTLAFSSFRSSSIETNPIGTLADFSRDVFVGDSGPGVADKVGNVDAGSAPEDDAEQAPPSEHE